eukprot:scaffold159180_cov33-Tisochrysis_lutea.AAC.3
MEAQVASSCACQEERHIAPERVGHVGGGGGGAGGIEGKPAGTTPLTVDSHAHGARRAPLWLSLEAAAH